VSVRLDIRVMPRSSKNEIGSTRDGRVIVRVTAPPVDGAANEAVIEILARTYHVPRGAVRIVKGHTGRNKTVEIEGVAAPLH